MNSGSNKNINKNSNIVANARANALNRKTNLFLIVFLCVFGFVSAVLLSKGRLAHSYAFENASQTINLLSYEHIEENVEINWDTGEYKPQNEDPWILFSGINLKNRGILISLKEPASEAISVKLYWTRQGEDALSESRTRTVTLDANEKTAYVKLPNYSVGNIRLDIDGECKIDTILVSDQAVKRELHINSDFLLAFIIRLIIIGVVLYVAYLAHVERVSAGGRLIKGLFVDESRPSRSYEYDYIRTLAALLVIMMHSVIENYAPTVSRGESGYLILKMVLAISLVCNALYIMLSGALLLRPKQESIADFYRKRLGKVLIPTICYYLLYMIQGYGSEVFSEGIGMGLWTILKGLLTSRPEYMLHMWFIYAILSLYIFAPFLRIVISHITEKQLFGLIIAGFVFDCFGTVLPMCGISFGIDTPIASWMGVFLLGYYMTTSHAKSKYKLFMILGLLGLAGTCSLVYFRPDLLYYESNWAPLMWVEGAGIFAFFIYFKGFFGKRNLIIASISKYNFSIMLVHVLLLMKFILPIGWRMEGEYGHLRIFILGIILVCFLVSYLVSVIYDNTVIIAVNYLYYHLMNKRSRS